MAHIERSNIVDVASAVHADFSKAGALEAGDFNGQAEKGAVATDTTAPALYQNVGTKAATVWERIATEADLTS